MEPGRSQRLPGTRPADPPHAPAARRRGGLDHAADIRERHEPAAGDELPRRISQALSRAHDVAEGAVPGQLVAHHRGHRLAGRDPGAGIGQQLVHSGHLGGRPGGEQLQVHGDAVGAAQQRGQPLRAQSLVGLRQRGAAREVAGEPVERRCGLRAGRAVAGTNGGPQAAHGPEERRGDFRRNAVQGADRVVDGRRPLGQVAAAGRHSVGRRGIVALVGRQVERLDVQERVAPVQLQVTQAGAQRRLGAGDGDVVEGVAQRRTAEGAEGLPDASWRQVLDLAVELMQSGVLPAEGQARFRNSPDAGRQLGQRTHRYSPNGPAAQIRAGPRSAALAPAATAPESAAAQGKPHSGGVSLRGTVLPLSGSGIAINGRA